ncbi:MAG: arylamine N-acetyltransferase [Pyrinomonadaceae bacterium]
MIVDVYLERIGLTRAGLSAEIGTLRRLQYRHLLSVPFENLDIHWKKPIVLDIERFFAKIVGERRGGFCYELNGLFNELLRSLGFATRLISARVFNGKEHGPEFDHAAIIVTIGDEEYLADVGFGDFTAEPLLLAFDLEQADRTGTFIIRRFDGEYLEVAKRAGETWKSEYIFKDIPHELSDFAEMCDFQQYSPDSHFTKGKLCSIMTANGRKTLTDSKFILTTDGEKVEADIAGEAEFYRRLDDEFGIERIQ